eukprot:m.129207 g.129207  ORF g.129207 m.129207 type:complete len:87 (-) comp17453_c0_seq28:975-1235(-)
MVITLQFVWYVDISLPFPSLYLFEKYCLLYYFTCPTHPLDALQVRELENIFVYVLGVAGVVAPPHILIENKTDAHKKTIMSYTKPR